MKQKDIYKLQTVSTTDNPCELVSALLLHLDGFGTFSEFIGMFHFGTCEEMSRGVAYLVKAVCLDKFMRSKLLRETNPFAYSVWVRFNRIFTDQTRFDKFTIATAGEIWNGGYSRTLIKQRTAELIAQEPDEERFAQVCERIKHIYQLTDADVEKLRFFVEQVKAGDAFPNSLRRMLYIWGEAKKTGKTTSATMLVTLLNGDMAYNNISKYSTTLANEMQIKSFAVPRISECNACLMDECFYSDMGKTYADFKRFITSSNGTARLPYGQEFYWNGQPNYIATSNDPLQVFIKDWNDRRYLSVEFKGKPQEDLSFEQIQALWLEFIQNSTPRTDFPTWAKMLEGISEEKGERETVAEEVEIDLVSNELLDRIIARGIPSNSPSCVQNRVSLKFFLDYFTESMGAYEARKRRREIETAVVRTFGERYGTQTWWLLSDLQQRACEIKNEAASCPNVYQDGYKTENEDKLPF